MSSATGRAAFGREVLLDDTDLPWLKGGAIVYRETPVPLADGTEVLVTPWGPNQPFAGSTKSMAKIMAQCEPALPVSAEPLAQAA